MLLGIRLLPLVLAGYLLMPGAGMGKELKKMTSLTITCQAFNHGEAIPTRFTCDGKDLNPALEWSAPPTGTRSLALIMDDPDAPVGNWVHWVVWNIPPDTRRIEEHSVPDGAVQGLNGWKRNAYGGPCPPSGSHRYFFKLHALDTILELPESATKADLEKAMNGHILAQGELMGTYRRR
ncbi:MAG: YbhB/YbcL family Raf kinase inhibitor-like protein [Geobacteraceae bacterium]|nr:YbhB/YbcL family Raf kinase inhibitor-like protein [Geobacteraceae bacterium]